MSQSEIETGTAKWHTGWNLGDRPFDGEVFRDLFAPEGHNMVVFDNVLGDVIVLRSAAEYVATWVPFMAPMTHWSTRLENLTIDISGDQAVTTFKLVGVDTRGADGDVMPFGQYGTHVWKRIDGVGWRIVHEHLTSYDRAKEIAEPTS